MAIPLDLILHTASESRLRHCTGCSSRRVPHALSAQRANHAALLARWKHLTEHLGRRWKPVSLPEHTPEQQTRGGEVLEFGLDYVPALIIVSAERAKQSHCFPARKKRWEVPSSTFVVACLLNYHISPIGQKSRDMRAFLH